MDGVIFKIDFEKAYDKVKWSFLQQVLRMKGFDTDWCDQIMKYIQGVVLVFVLMMTLVIIFKKKGFFREILSPPYSSI